MKNSILPSTAHILKQLQLKHPEGKKASQDILLTDTAETIDRIKFENIDAEKIVEVSKKICSIGNQSAFLKAFLPSRLIPLGKDHGLRPIGRGEALRHIADKVFVIHFRTKIVTLVGSL